MLPGLAGSGHRHKSRLRAWVHQVPQSIFEANVVRSVGGELRREPPRFIVRGAIHMPIYLQG